MTGEKLAQDRKPTANSRLPQWGLTWLNQVQCFYQHLCLVDSFVLRNPPLRQAAKRYNLLLRFVIQVQFLMESSGLKNQNFTHNLIE